MPMRWPHRLASAQASCAATLPPRCNLRGPRIAPHRKRCEAAFLLIAESPQVLGTRFPRPSSYPTTRPPSSSPARMVGCSATGRETALKYDVLGALYNDAGIARTQPALHVCLRSTCAAFPPRRFRRPVRASATRAPPTRTASSAASTPAPLRSACAKASAPASSSLGCAAPSRHKEETMSPTLQNRPAGTMTGGPRACRDVASGRRRTDVRHGRFPVAPVLRRRRSRWSGPPPHQRRTLRPPSPRTPMQGSPIAPALRRHARTRRDQPRHRTRRVH